MADVLFEAYLVKQISDRTEGKGQMKIIATYSSESAAKAKLNTIGGVMGSDSGKEIWKIIYCRVPDSKRLAVAERLVWGYRKLPDGSWDYGWVDLRDIPENDPEYQEYLRLTKKFQKSGGVV